MTRWKAVRPTTCWLAGRAGDTVSYANAGGAVTVSLAAVAAQNTLGAEPTR